MKTSSEAARALVRARWSKTTKQQRRDIMDTVRAYATGEKAGGRPRDHAKPRCMCGANTLTRAQSRGYDCCRAAGLAPIKQDRRGRKPALKKSA